MNTASLVSVNVGRPKLVEWNGKTIRTSIWKSAVSGRTAVHRLNIEGDEQSDLDGHGGEQRAVLVYQLSSYRYWNERLGCSSFEYGQYGENLTVDGLEDAEVCIGDRYRIGSAVFEVSQPRVTCYKLGARMRHQELPSLLVAHGRPGFYMRVIQEGDIAPGDRIEKILAGAEGMTVASIDALLYKADHPTDSLIRALRIGALSPGWKLSFEALLKSNQSSSADASDGNTGLVPASNWTVHWKGFRKVRVVQTCEESDDVRSFLVAAVDGKPLPDARPGQHIAVKVALGPGDNVVTRLYSLSGPPGLGQYRFSVKREAAGTASRFLHTWARVGSTFEIGAPRGAFFLSDGSAPVVLLSAGIGVTPMMAMLFALSRSPETGRPIWWVHSARDSKHHPFRCQVEEQLAKLKEAHSYVTYSQPGPDDIVGQDCDAKGRLTVATLQELGVPQSADFYLCGPTEFLADMQSGLRVWGVTTERIHAEVFGTSATPAAAFTPKNSPHLPAGEQGAGPSVSFVRSGVSVRWSERYQSLLELAEACDVPTRWSCRTGVCHSCQTALIDGSVRYIPSPLSPAARGTVLLCCAQPKGDLQLDL